MKTLPQLLCLAAVASLATLSSPAQDPNAPPDQGAPPPDQGAPPPGQPMDQGAAPDQGAPGPDQGGPGPAPDQGAPDDQGGGDASFQTFYDNLSSQGNWVQTDNYGYVWQPNVQDPDWRPYSQGHWVYTDAGWTWIADDSEPWGWATYHYGRWVNLDGEGWAWVPGYTWAPAWVSWRYGGGYCGWAPLPPDTFVGIDFGGGGGGFHIGGDVDVAFGIGAGYYNFVPVGYIGASDYRPYYANRYNNFAIINNTRNVTNIVVNNNYGGGGAAAFGRVRVGGPAFATINAQSQTPIQRVQLSTSNRVGNASLSGGRLAVFAPRVRAASAGTTFRPRTVAGTVGQVRVNRGADISRPLAVNSHISPPAATGQQVQAARAAEASAPRDAHIARAGVQPSHALTAPLTTMAPRPSVRIRTAATTGYRATGANGEVHNNAAVTRPEATAPRTESTFTGEAPETRHTTTATHPQGETYHHETQVNPTSNGENRPTTEERTSSSFSGAAAQREVTPATRDTERTTATHTEAPRPDVSHPAATHPAATHPSAEHTAPQHASSSGHPPADDKKP